LIRIFNIVCSALTDESVKMSCRDSTDFTMPQRDSTLDESGRNSDFGGAVVVTGGIVVVVVDAVLVVVDVLREPLGRLPRGIVVGPAVVEGAAKENFDRSTTLSSPSKPGAAAD
jgi:hypothetical protein